MDVRNGVLHLLPRPYDRSQYNPVDHFFKSLAGWAGSRAVGVILSGTASDGTAGIREIKASGGITIAQRPETAKYDGMPRASIATGLVDLVLSPQEIGAQLAHIQAHPYMEAPAAKVVDSPEPTEAQLAEIFRILRRVSGIDFRQYKTPTVKRRLLRRMALRRLTAVDAYIGYLRNDDKEALALYQDLLIHVTRFFREPESFDVLAREVFSELIAERPEDESIRIWVPGCATGEETYSVAMVLMEALGDHANGRRVQIFATDVSESAIEHARGGTYPASIATDVPNDRLKRFFNKVDAGYKVSKSLRDMCVFARHDLTRDPPFSRLDLIVCRNVMIYLDLPLQRRLMSVFHYALRPRGFLMLGAAESAGVQRMFTIVDKRWRLYRKSAIDMASSADFKTERLPVPAVPESAPVQATGRTPARSVGDEANRLLLQRYSPAGVVVDDNLQIVQFRGQTGRFLEPASGEPNLSVLKMAREGLLFPLRSALQAARRKRRTVRREGIAVLHGGEWHDVNLEVVPLNSSDGHLLIVFEEALQPSRTGAKSTGRRRRDGGKREADERLASVTRELAANREYMQSIIQELEAANEELQSANEEVLSSNEELQSTNEELDTAKEELQSTNEELNTVNEELHSRNDELSQANSDLINLLAIVDITIVIVGNDMRIRRFTPTAERMLNLIAADVGRPLGQINTNLSGADVEGLARETIDTFVSKEMEVQDRFGKWYSLRTRPYKNVDNRIDGAVLMLIDINAAKQLRQHVERSREQLLQTVDLFGEPVVVLDEALQVKSANAAFYSTFNFNAAATVGKPLAELTSDSWDFRRLHMFTQQLDGLATPILNVPFNDLDGSKHLVASARQFMLEDGKSWTILALSAGHVTG
jgi:two-component system CheB/CheR fusion protein